MSYFGFSPPTDKSIWKQAQSVASSGYPILIHQIKEYFPHPLNFLDGNRYFQTLQSLIDDYIDPKNMFSPITSGIVTMKYQKRYAVHRLRNGAKLTDFPRKGYENWKYLQRAPILHIGYRGVPSTGQDPQDEESDVTSFHLPKHLDFLEEFHAIESLITHPSIFICLLNENWGWLSTVFPNRTTSWGRFPKTSLQKKYLTHFLNSDKVIMLIVNQHLNISHPKILVLPRGISLLPPQTRIVWDSIRYFEKYEKKTALLVSFSSNWGPRLQILRCISRKFSPSDFIGHVDGIDANEGFGENLKTDTLIENRTAYYIKFGRGRFGLMLPGLGYDCFRNWEMLLMGTIGIVERGVGFDRMFWRLPVLLVDDFAEVTPSLLQIAYVEAMYRALRREFEFERLQQSFWYSLVYNASVSKSAEEMIEKFPLEAEKPNFVRPLIPFYCGNNGEDCENPLIRSPKMSC